MSKRLDETIGAVGFDNLINGQYQIGRAHV